MRPLLFLDFDGIINSENLEDEIEELFLDDRFTGESYSKNLTDNLSKFIKENDFNIVISSTWRRFFSFFELQQVLSLFKIDADRLLDITPDIGQERYKDIELWLDTNEELKEHSFSFFFVLDDNSDAWTDSVNFYQVDTKTGFTEYHRKEVNERIKYFERLLLM